MKSAAKPIQPKLVTDALAELGKIRPLNFLFLSIAGVVNAFGVTMFLFPVRLYDSGVSGLSMLLDQITRLSVVLAGVMVAPGVSLKKTGTKGSLERSLTVKISSSALCRGGVQGCRRGARRRSGRSRRLR